MVAAELALLLAFAAITTLMLLGPCFKEVKPHEKGLYISRGRLTRVLDPGRYFVRPFADELIRVEMRAQVFEFRASDLETKDKKEFTMNLFINVRVVDAEKAVLEVTNYRTAIGYRAVAIAGDVVSEIHSGEIPSSRDLVESKIMHSLSRDARKWGVEINEVRSRIWGVDPGDCPNCGLNCPAGFTYCSRCGSRLVPESAGDSGRYRQAGRADKAEIGPHKVKVAWSPDNLTAPYEVDGVFGWRRKKDSM